MQGSLKLDSSIYSVRPTNDGVHYGPQYLYNLQTSSNLFSTAVY